jgi:hypothetical protein
MTRRGLIRKIELQEIKKKIRFYIIQTKNPQSIKTEGF